MPDCGIATVAHPKARNRYRQCLPLSRKPPVSKRPSECSRRGCWEHRKGKASLGPFSEIVLSSVSTLPRISISANVSAFDRSAVSSPNWTLTTGTPSDVNVGVIVMVVQSNIKKKRGTDVNSPTPDPRDCREPMIPAAVRNSFDEGRALAGRSKTTDTSRSRAPVGAAANGEKRKKSPRTAVQTLQLTVRPGKFLFRMTPTSGFVRLRGRISAHAPEKNRV